MRLALIIGATACALPAQPSYFTATPATPEVAAAPRDSWGDPAPAPTTSPPTERPAITFTLPAGFRDNAGWYVTTKREQVWPGERLTSGLVRVLPPVAAGGDLGAATRDAWARYVPPEIRASESRLVFRRYVGNGLTAHFVHGRGVERNHKLESWFAMHVIDCGTTWQPVLIAATYDELPSTAGDIMNVRFQLPAALAMVEPLLATIRCAGPRDQPIVAAAAMAGHYYFGSGAYQQYVNVDTGATTSRSLSYAGEYDLASDGTATYKYSSASNNGGGTTFAGDGGRGRWVVAGDLLIIELAGKKPKRMRIASVTQLSDAKVAVLLDEGELANPVAVERGTVYATKP